MLYLSYSLKCHVIQYNFPGEQLVQRCVIIQRDEKGYGLTVSGDNPVFVQSVKDSKFSLFLSTF